MPLTDSNCRQAKPRTKAYKLFDGARLYLEIKPHGSKFWRLKYRHAGKENRIAAAARQAGHFRGRKGRWRLHPLSGDLAGHWSVWVNGNWRMTFGFVEQDAVLVDYRDYH